jgi:thymidylate synthase ThyX
MFSRNASSSRAIPVEKVIAQVQDDPVMPVWWGKNQSGMVASQELAPDAKEKAIKIWLQGRDCAVTHVRKMLALGVHKQIANRLLFDWKYITVIVSSTEWDNFFKLRCAPDAQPEMQKIAMMMQELYLASTPMSMYSGEWHLPFVPEDEEVSTMDHLLALSAARCARVSYLTHDGEHDPEKDLKLAKRLWKSGHMSPFEHVATPINDLRAMPAGNFSGWHQYRHRLEG